VGKALCADALAEMCNGLRVAEKVLEAHGLSLEHLRFAMVGVSRIQGLPPRRKTSDIRRGCEPRPVAVAMKRRGSQASVVLISRGLGADS
jgi:hypothetical protein